MEMIFKKIFLPGRGAGFCLSSEMNLAFRSALTHERCGNDGGMTCMCWASAL